MSDTMAVTPALEGLSTVQARIAELRSMMGLPSTGTGSVGGTSSQSTSFASLLADALATDTGTDDGSSSTDPTSGSTTLADTLSGVLGGTSSGSTTGTSATSSADLGAAAVSLAKSYTGVPYKWGGENPASGVDCSGLVQYVYGRLGITLPRVAADQSRSGTKVASLADAQPGDLVFFGKPAHHVGIYVGNGKMIDAPHTGTTVGVHKLWGTPSSIRRVVPQSSDGTGVLSTVSAQSASALTSVSGSSSTGSLSGPYASLFVAAGRRYGVDPALLSAVAKTESGYNSRAVSAAGAQGMMQLMPSTARSLGVTNSFDATQAVNGAAKLLSGLLDDFGGRTDLALAAYNAGPSAVRKYGGVPPYTETQNYVRRVTAYQEALS